MRYPTVRPTTAAPVAVENHRVNVEIALGCRVNRCSQEGSLARQGKAHAFDADNYGYYDQAINVDEMRNEIHGVDITL